MQFNQNNNNKLNIYLSQIKLINIKARVKLFITSEETINRKIKKDLINYRKILL